MSITSKKVSEQRMLLMEVIEAIQQIRAVNPAELVRVLEEFIDAKLEQHEHETHEGQDDR